MTREVEELNLCGPGRVKAQQRSRACALAHAELSSAFLPTPSSNACAPGRVSRRPAKLERLDNLSCRLRRDEFASSCIQKDCGWGPAVTWHAAANQRADRTSQLGFKQTTVRSTPPKGPPRKRNLLPKWKRSRKRQQRRINLQTKKCKQKGKGEQRENRPKWLTKKLKKIYLQKTGKRKLRRVQPLMKQERKKPSLINTIYHVLPVVPVSLLVQSRGIFLSTIL
ncbi:PREDICTED: non-histone chromosomal protein HMG-14 [Colobus angolensis palliatus]|uniref:non-histone chromosomal protein HMG-14 n=1 Tax=Colobus angolensis palliatus TaxID=336983 RepID=UPI0005F42CDF|nr:PREDICTED: non-histone chromosomal protein HMG-14 [Colobus angolensis palliatus]